MKTYNVTYENVWKSLVKFINMIYKMTYNDIQLQNEHIFLSNKIVHYLTRGTFLVHPSLLFLQIFAN